MGRRPDRHQAKAALIARPPLPQKQSQVPNYAVNIKLSGFSTKKLKNQLCCFCSSLLPRYLDANAGNQQYSR
jgi:hypothetical protein